MKKRNNDWPRAIIDAFIIFAITALIAIIIAKCSANTTVPDTYEAQATEYSTVELSDETTYEVTAAQTPATIHEQDTEVKTHLYYDIPLDEDLQDYILEVCHGYGVNHLIVLGMIEKESAFGPNVIGDNGEAFGLMQVQPKWHQERMDRLGVTDISDPYQNVLVGVDYFAEMLSYDRGIAWALMAYNGGATYANELTDEGVISSYVTDVFDNAGRIRPVY